MNFKTVLDLIDTKINGYSNTLLPPEKDWELKLKEHYNFVPEFFHQIYDCCNGSPTEFIPSYNLTSISEIIDFKSSYMYSIINDYRDEYIADNLDNATTDDVQMTILPFLCDLSSNYICYFKLNDIEKIVSFTSEEGIVNMYEVDKFFETIYQCYSKDVYFLAEDDLLDCDYDEESEISNTLNPKADFWL